MIGFFEDRRGVVEGSEERGVFSAADREAGGAEGGEASGCHDGR